MRRPAKIWLESACDDLEVAEEIIDREDLTHMVAFHCQQAIEKSLKAVLEENEQVVPRIHDLITLLSSTEEYIELEIDSKLLTLINESYIDARYPPDIGMVPGNRPTIETSREMYFLARRIWERTKRRIA